MPLGSFGHMGNTSGTTHEGMGKLRPCILPGKTSFQRQAKDVSRACETGSQFSLP